MDDLKQKQTENEKNLNLWIIGINEWEEYQVNAIGQVFNKRIEGKISPSKRKSLPYKYKKHTQHQIKKTSKKKILMV